MREETPQNDPPQPPVNDTHTITLPVATATTQGRKLERTRERRAREWFSFSYVIRTCYFETLWSIHLLFQLKQRAILPPQIAAITLACWFRKQNRAERHQTFLMQHSIMQFFFCCFIKRQCRKGKQMKRIFLSTISVVVILVAELMKPESSCSSALLACVFLLQTWKIINILLALNYCIN